MTGLRLRAESGLGTVRVVWRIAALLLLAAGGLVLPARAQTSSAAGFWHTSGTTILDAEGNSVRIAGVTWYGMESSTWVPAGLSFQRYTTIMDIIKLLGYNTIRIPFSGEMVERNPIVNRAIAANPQFRGMHALQVLDAIVAYAQQIGLKVILVDQRNRASRPKEVNSPNEPFWYSQGYPESSWIHDWETLAQRYLTNDAVIGFDLRNEPHPSGPGPWNLQAYVQRSPTWGPYKGVENAARDWRLAAERAGNAILAINPHLLIIVEGLTIYPDKSVTKSVMPSWWAGILTPAARYPVVLNVPHHLVYSVHEYGPRKHFMPWFKHMTYRSLKAAWHSHWGFLLDNPKASDAAPILIGEFGTCTNLAICVGLKRPGNQAAWFLGLMRFLKQHPNVGWSFFALNGTNANNCPASNGVMNVAWNNVASVALQRQLTGVEPTPGVVPANSKMPLVAGAKPARTPLKRTAPLCTLR